MGWGLILGQEVENFAVEAEDGRMLHALCFAKVVFPLACMITAVCQLALLH